MNKELREPYLDRENPEQRRQIQQIFGLPFVRLDDLKEVFDAIVAEKEDKD